MDPITLILGVANLVPGIAKFLHAGSTTQKIADEAGAIASTIAGVADPGEALARIQTSGAGSELQQKFQLEVMSKMASWDQMFLQDVQSARSRDVELAKVGYRNYRAHAMFALAVLVILWLVWIIWKSPDINEYVKGIFTLVLGRFLGYLDNIYNFEFGTTRQSHEKDQTIKQLTRNGNP